MSDPGKTATALEGEFPAPETADNINYNPSLARLRELARGSETTTEFGSPAYTSEQHSRSSDQTRNAIDDGFDSDDYRIIEDLMEYARTREMVCLDRRMGRHPDHSYICRYYVPTDYARIAFAWAKLLEPVDENREPDFRTIQAPNADEIAIRVLPDAGVTGVLGSDYTGEAKKSFLRLFMHRARQKGAIGLHAGSKRVTLRTESGGSDDVGQVFLGLSATGKSTLTAHGYWLDDPEAAEMLQDDVCAVLPGGAVAGTEGKGLYIKTHGLTSEEQPGLYEAATHESAVFENVAVNEDGTVDFDSDEHTRNARAVVLREHLSSASEDVDLDSVDQIFFITRNPTMPPIARLSTAEAAAAFMLGESVQTSAGDPSKAGDSIRAVGTNPFIIGSRGEEGNRFYDLVDDLDTDCFVLNTGYLGDESVDIGVEDTVTILRELARGTIEWTDDERTGFTIPQSVSGMDIRAFSVSTHVDDYEQRLQDLRDERRSYLSKFDALRDEIKTAVY